MSKAGEDSSEEWTSHENGPLRAGLLTAITADTDLIFMCRWLGIITVVPINSFGFYWAHLDANAATGAFGSVDYRPLGYPIFEEGPN